MRRWHVRSNVGYARNNNNAEHIRSRDLRGLEQSEGRAPLRFQTSAAQPVDLAARRVWRNFVRGDKDRRHADFRSALRRAPAARPATALSEALRRSYARSRPARQIRPPSHDRIAQTTEEIRLPRLSAGR